VDLNTVKIGQSIHFSLSQSDIGDYVIHIIHQPDPAGTDADPSGKQPEDAS